MSLECKKNHLYLGTIIYLKKMSIFPNACSTMGSYTWPWLSIMYSWQSMCVMWFSCMQGKKKTFCTFCSTSKWAHFKNTWIQHFGRNSRQNVNAVMHDYLTLRPNSYKLHTCPDLRLQMEVHLSLYSPTQNKQASKLAQTKTCILTWFNLEQTYCLSWYL